MSEGNYTVLVARSLDELCGLSRDFIRMGWEPTGGISESRSGSYMQPMWVRPVDERKEFQQREGLSDEEMHEVERLSASPQIPRCNSQD